MPLHPYKSAEAASDASMVVEARTLNPDNGKASMRNAQRTAKAPRNRQKKYGSPRLQPWEDVTSFNTLASNASMTSLNIDTLCSESWNLSDSVQIDRAFTYSIVWVAPTVKRLGVIYATAVDVPSFISSQKRAAV